MNTKAFNYKLDIKLLPKVWVYWETKRDGSNFLNCQTGKIKHTPEDWMDTCGGYRYRRSEDDKVAIGYSYHTRLSERIWVTANSRLQSLYMKYHKDKDILEMSVVQMDTIRKPISREWKFVDRIFIDKNKNIYNVDGLSITAYYGGRIYAWDKKSIISNFLKVECNIDKCLDEFKKFIGADYFLIGNGSTVNIDSFWHISHWYNTVQKQRGKGKQQKLTDRLVAIPLQPTNNLSEKYPAKKYENRWGTNTISNFVYFEPIDDEWVVLRAFIRNDNDLNEPWRAYICKDGTVRVVSKNQHDDNWIPSQKRRGWRHGDRYFFANPEEAKSRFEIKYALEAIENNKNNTDNFQGEEHYDTYLIDDLLTAIKFPEIEQLFKLGAPYIARRVMTSTTPKAQLRYEFGGYYNENENNILRKIGMTKPQFDIYVTSKNRWCNYKSLEKMRKYFGDDLSYMDIESFKEYYKMCEELSGRYFSFEPLKEVGIEELKFIKNICRIARKHESVYGVVADTLSDYSRLDSNTHPEIDWLFDDFSDLVRAHDAVNALKLRQDEERRARYDAEAKERLRKQEEKRKKIDEERQVYNYKEEDFIIRLPIDLNEIVNEGSRQRICIGGYTDRHARGFTNIFLLRKADEPNIPFYAIEMDNDKRIVQIHGYCNQWLGNNPEAIPTVIRWLRKNGIKCKDEILTCKAKGYGSCNDFVPMPQVD